MDLIARIPDIVLAVLKGGTAGYIAAGIAVVLTVILNFVLRRKYQDAKAKENDERRVADQAKNPVENDKDEKQADDAVADLEEALRKKDT